MIAFIFIKKAIEKVAHIGDYYPIHPSECYCKPSNETLLGEFGTAKEFSGFDAVKPHKYPCEFDPGTGTMIDGFQSVGCHYHPNAFLMSILLFIGTFLFSWHLKKFKTANFFPTFVRNFISDFAVIIGKCFSIGNFVKSANADSVELSARVSRILSAASEVNF